MNNIMEMGATARHGRLIGLLQKSIFDLFFKKNLIHFSESTSLVYYGNKKTAPGNCELVDISRISDIKFFKEEVMADLDHVVPDYMHFVKNNNFILNKKETRAAGFPDLIIEVWSQSNSDFDKAYLKHLYGTSGGTEHWYIEQDSNIVECWLGDQRVEDKNLKDILITRDGIEFDLRYLKL